MITHHTQLLQALIDKYGLKSYLEIGVQNPANNFDKIVCKIKQGVDPEVKDTPHIFKLSSDFFFKLQLDNLSERIKFDLIFIDGLHHADQCKRDFENSLRCLSDNGFIVIHDVLPENEEGTLVPRQTKMWWGDVYKWAMGMCYNYCDIVDFKTFNIDNGCMVVWKSPSKTNRPPHEVAFDWQTYLTHGRTLMNVTDAVEI